MKKLIVVALVSLMSVSAFAGPYVEAKNKIKFTEFDNIDLGSGTNHLRLGYKGKNTYIEAGAMSDGGTSAEAGYKFKFDNGFTVKGMIESTNVDAWKHGVETEIRYSF